MRHRKFLYLNDIWTGQGDLSLKSLDSLLNLVLIILSKSASSINHWLSPETKAEGTCNFIYLVRKGRLSFMPNYSSLSWKEIEVIEIQILHFITLFIEYKDWAYKRNINNLLLNKSLRNNLSLKTHMSVSFIYRYICYVYLENGL